MPGSPAIGFHKSLDTTKMILHLVNCYLVCNGKTSKIGRHYLNTVKLSSLYDNTRCAIHPALRISAFYSILIIPYRLGIVVKII